MERQPQQCRWPRRAEASAAHAQGWRPHRPASSMGDLSHELETLFMQIDSGVVAADDRAFGLAQTSLDELARMRESVSSGKGVPTANALIAKIHALVSGTPAANAPAPPPPAPPAAPAPRTSARHGCAGASDGCATTAAHRRASARTCAGAEACAGSDDFRRACAQSLVRAATATRRTRARAAGACGRVGAFVRAAVHRDACRGEGTHVRRVQP